MADKSDKTKGRKSSKKRHGSETAENSSDEEVPKWARNLTENVAASTNSVKQINGEVTELKEDVSNFSESSGVGHADIMDSELFALAREISSNNMHQIALSYLKLKSDVVDTENAAARENQWKFNFNLLKLWRNQNKGDNARQKLDEALSKAAKQGGLVNYPELQKILGTDVDLSSENPATSKKSTVPKTASRHRARKRADSVDEESELTDKMLLELSKRITERQELRTLAMHGLEMQDHVIDRHLNNQRHDITEAGYGILREWLKRQTDRRDAYKKLRHALESVNMRCYTQVLD